MPNANHLPEILETTEAERLATGFTFTEGPLWHPDGFYYFVDLRADKLYRMTPGQKPELVRETQEGNGTTFDLQGRLIHCEGRGRCVTRLGHDSKVEIVADRFMGGRFNRPNDVVCRSDGSPFLPIRTSACLMRSARYRLPRASIISGMVQRSIVWRPTAP